MDASLSLRRPNNWADFETLCKKLWGEIWDCPEIKKNGRTGQSQHGVDVYGVPLGENMFYGIQCKGKDEYTNKQFSENEITNEIIKAKSFQPPLKKLYFATTAVKDVGIEEFVRKKNIENVSNGLFEVHIFSWEDIVELIDENKRTHDFYVKSQNFRTRKSVGVTFKGGLNEITLAPRYSKTIVDYKQKIVPPEPYTNPFNHIFSQQENLYNRLNPLVVSVPMSGTKVNRSYCNIFFEIRNTGYDPIEDYKLLFSFEGEVIDLKKTNEESYGLVRISPHLYLTDVYLSPDSKSGKVVPKETILVGDETFVSDDIFIKTSPKECDIVVNWKLISKDFKDEGHLKILVRPDFEIKYRESFVEDSTKLGIKETDFEEVIDDESDD